jgi:hypothetical protein
MPRQGRFYSYNIIRNEQRDRLEAVATPIATLVPGHDALFNTYSLYQNVNTGSRRRREDNSDEDNSDEDLTPRPAQRRRHRCVDCDLPPEEKPDLLNKMFPDKPCVECGTLLLYTKEQKA